MHYASRTSMSISNIRERYPLHSSILTDMFDHVYHDLTELLGWHSSSGVLSVSGSLRESIHDVWEEGNREFGSEASGITEAFIMSSGSFGAYCSSGNALMRSTMALIDNPYA